MLLSELVQVSRAVSEARSRLTKFGALAQCLRRLEPAEIPIAVCYLSGELRQGRIGVGYATLGELRAVAAASTPSLTLEVVDGVFARLQARTGRGSSSERDRLLGELFARATAEEQTFLARLVLGELRQGALEGIMLEAIARAAQVDTEVVRRATMLSGSLGEVATAALTQGEPGLSRFSIELFRPLSPMLAQTADLPEEALSRWGRAALEYKLDGARIQVHRIGNDVRVFSRQLNDVSHSVPEIVERVLALPVREVILDGEAIALTPEGRPRPFQVTMRRFGRKLEVARLRDELPLVPFFFDCLYLDGQPLIDRTNAERYAALSERIPPEQLTQRALADTPVEIATFLNQALSSAHEGIMLKSLEAPYEAGRRGASWLKLKPAHTLDLVVLAAEWGSGRRVGWLSNLHLGALDPKTGGFAMLGKTFKGMTDALLAWQTEKLGQLEIRREGQVVHVRPELVVEVAFDGIQTSPHYPSGLALRFARIKRYRPDKSPADADTIDTVREIHLSQTGGAR